MEAFTMFTVDYSYNCDGGEQEFNTARMAIQKIFPNAAVRGDRNHNYPIKVVIKDRFGKEVWSGQQRRLFRKYPDLRDQSINEIGAALKFLKKAPYVKR